MAASPPPPPSARPVPGVRRRVLLAGLLVVALALVLLAGEALVVGRAESRIASAVADQLAVDVEVDITSRPAAVGVLAGRIDAVSLTATDVPLEGQPVTIDTLEVDASGITFDGDEVTDGAATFRAVLAEDQVRAAVPVLLAGLLVVTDDALVLDAGLLRVPLALSVVDDALRVRPDGALAEAAGALLGDPDGLVDPIPLHSPDGVVVTGVVVEPEGLVFTGTLDPVVLSR
ncbi:LmeA family phospholipid-binding protein [Euzebya rosea]|uniref:LmeA family phospholipid-binding protein n=1 Tax=Euzebya rosea TaxID=2052804 RepID=UPI001475F0CC|nr:LmeA family phospholipid-binding protein [Euzebya rosea]